MRSIFNVMKKMKCLINSYFLYVFVNESVLCNCEIETESHFLLESLVTYLVMYFTVNLAFVNYFDNSSSTKQDDLLKIELPMNQYDLLFGYFLEDESSSL